MTFHINYTFTLILSEEKGYEAPYYVIFSISLVHLLSQIQILFSALRFKISSTYLSLLNLRYRLLLLRSWNHRGGSKVLDQGRAIAQAVSRWLPTAVARVPTRR
jgi:hypothetical protein